MQNFQVLYYFTSPDYSLMETKKLDLPSSAAPGAIYKWVVYDHNLDQFYFLTFKSMKKDANLEYRSFEEGELSFNLSEAQFQFKGHPIVLNREIPEEMDEKLLHGLGKNL